MQTSEAMQQYQAELDKYNKHCFECKNRTGGIIKKADTMQYVKCNKLGEVKLIRLGAICWENVNCLFAAPPVLKFSKEFELKAMQAEYEIKLQQ